MFQREPVDPIDSQPACDRNKRTRLNISVFNKLHFSYIISYHSFDEFIFKLLMGNSGEIIRMR